MILRRLSVTRLPVPAMVEDSPTNATKGRLIAIPDDVWQDFLNASMRYWQVTEAILDMAGIDPVTGEEYEDPEDGDYGDEEEDVDDEEEG